MSRTAHVARRTAANLTATAAVAGLGTGAWAARHRASAMASGWSPGAGRLVQAGPLTVRVLEHRADGSPGSGGTIGADDEIVLLLHGMLGAGSYFGGDWDRLARPGRTLVVPDLLGFAGSMGAAGPYDEAHHVEAIEAAVDALDPQTLGLTHRRDVLVVGHSMGASLALRWAARTVHRVTEVVAISPALFHDPDEAKRHIASMGAFERLLSGDGRLARWTCDAMCRWRDKAQWLAVAGRPDLPVPVARDGVQHTWSSYRGAMRALVKNGGWQSAAATLRRKDVPVTFLVGDRDPVPSRRQLADAEREAAEGDRVRVHRHPRARHDLPLSHPGWCLARISRDDG